MSSKNCISLRTALLANCHDLVANGQFSYHNIHAFVCELSVALSGYTEEERMLYLDAYIIDDLLNFLRELPGSSHIPLGVFSYTSGELKKALKRSAPLARGAWKIYFHIDKDKFYYGLFRNSGNPLSVPVEGSFINSDTNIKYIRVNRIDRKSVSIATKYDTTIIDFSSVEKDISDHSGDIARIIEEICMKINDNGIETYKTVAHNILDKSLKESHGAIIAVANDDIKQSIADGMFFETPLDIPLAISNALKDERYMHELNTLEDIIIGSFCCDGIVMFSSRFEFLGYNIFVSDARSSQTSHGGARHRAYLALSEMPGIRAVFYQSQDGNTGFNKVD